MRIIFTASGEFGVPTLESLIAGGNEIVAVYTQPDRPSGRGRKLTATAVAQFAENRNLPIIRTSDLNSESLPQADVMIVIAFGQKIAPAVVTLPRLGSINLHASLLPRYRGAAPINWAIIRGESVTGNSIIRLASVMDAGDVIAQSRLDIGDYETAGELHDRLAIDGAALVIRALELLDKPGTPQDSAQATHAPKLNRESSRIDWNQYALQIARQIRGMYPWPGCRARLLDAAGTEMGRVTIVRAVAEAGEGDRWRPGEIGMLGDISAANGEGAVKILEIQPAGKRPMPMEDFRRGHSWMAGMKLESITE